MKVLLVFLVFFFYCFSSNAQMQEEGTTVTTETTSEIQGDLEKVTTTTTTTVIENKNSGAILSSESTGIVAEKYEGDMDIDWGGQGPINSHTSCNGKLGEYTGNNTCASARLDSLTTWRQTVDLSQFSIDDGGQVRWEMRFGMEPSMYDDANKNAFVELKGYDGGALQWTDVYNVDKSTFSLSTSGTSSGNYLGPNGFIYDNLDYAGGLDSLYINIGGYGEFMFDSVWFDIYYNQIETTIAETIVYNLIEQEIQNNTSIVIDYNYNSGGDNLNNTLAPTDVAVIDLGIEDTSPPIEDSGGDSGGIDNNLGGVDNMSTTTIDVFTNIDTSTPVVTQTTDSGAGANVDTMFNNITMDIDQDQISNIQVAVADIANTDTTTTTQDTNTDTPTVETPTTENNTTGATDVAVNNVETNNEIEPPTVNAPSESEGTNENTNTENIQEVEATENAKVESNSTNEVNTDSTSNENETEVSEAPNNEESSEAESNNQVTEKTETEEVQEEAKEESQPEETETASGGGEEEPKEPAEEQKEEAQEEEEPKKEIAQKEEQKEEPKKEAKEEPKEESEEKQVAEKETEQSKPEQKQTKEEKKEEQKQEKAKKIMANFDSQYDAIAQITTLALVNALGPNMSSYSQEVIVQAPTWYEPKDIYSDVIIPDPLGNYFGVRDSLTYNKMIDMQYE